MATLYKRATPPQARILRAIEGAVKNVSDAHGIAFDPRHARSIAKRACGTLTAQWPDVLAATKMPSNWDAQLAAQSARSTTSQCGKGSRPSRGTMMAKRGQSEPVRLAPLRKLEKAIAAQIRPLKNAGKNERVEAFIDILRLIAAMKG